MFSYQKVCKCFHTKKFVNLCTAVSKFFLLCLLVQVFIWMQIHVFLHVLHVSAYNLTGFTCFYFWTTLCKFRCVCILFSPELLMPEFPYESSCLNWGQLCALRFACQEQIKELSAICAYKWKLSACFARLSKFLHVCARMRMICIWLDATCLHVECLLPTCWILVPACSPPVASLLLACCLPLALLEPASGPPVACFLPACACLLPTCYKSVACI